MSYGFMNLSPYSDTGHTIGSQAMWPTNGCCSLPLSLTGQVPVTVSVILTTTLQVLLKLIYKWETEAP